MKKKIEQTGEASASKMHRVTRADVARRAGVSETIVSYVINKNRYVAADKRKRVEEAIAELNYRPNVIARALRKKSSHQILLLGDMVMDEYYGEILSELDKAAYDKGYLVSLCKCRNDNSYWERVLTGQFDGVIINSTGFKEESIRLIAGAGIATVLFMTKKYKEIPTGVATIDSGLFDGVLQALELLWQKGAREIVYLAEPARGRDLYEDIRFLAFEEFCKKKGISRQKTLANTFFGYESKEWEEHFKVFAEQKKEMDAVFGRNDKLAARAIKVLQGLDKKIPQDMMVIGVDNASISKLMNPTITTIDLQKEEMSKAAISLIEAMAGGERSEIHRQFQTKIIERESTRGFQRRKA